MNQIKFIQQHKKTGSLFFFLSVILIPLIIVQTGCKKFVQVSPPVTQLVTSSVFNSDASATAAQLSIYANMVSTPESWNLSQNTGLLSDELTNYSTVVSQVQLYTNSMTASASTAFGPWNTAYNYIYQANAIISNLQSPGGISSTAAKQLTGESKFIRAFWLFYLVNCYGDVPLIITPDYSANANITRAPKSQVYQQIIADLVNAQQLLNTNYIDATDTAKTTERVRPTKGAAAALLARAYLYSGKYDSAVAQASIVINDPLYSLASLTPSNSNYVFNKNSTEAIWQLSTPLPTPNGSTADGNNYILTLAPTNVAISTQLLSAFEFNDNRRNIWVGSYTTTSSPPKTYYFPYKYRSTRITNGANVTEYVMVLRLAEQYLIRAEAEAHLGDSTNAVIDLNKIRSRSGLPGYSLAVNGPLLAAILHERQVELFTEWGNRWFDLNRTGTVSTVLGNPGNVYQFKGGIGTWNSAWQLYPIPQNDINIDPNLTQNTGY